MKNRSSEKDSLFNQTDRSDPTDRSDLPDRSDPADPTDGSLSLSRSNRLRPSGGYRRLRTFRVTTIIYDATVAFCQRFVDKHSRTIDQMVQAARSGRQNIAEGSRASATSSQTELRLVNVARASLDELLLDYEDFLRQRNLEQWEKDSPQAREVRALSNRDQTDMSDPADRSGGSSAYVRWLDHHDPAVVANALICLIHQANYLLDRQIAGLESSFIQEGGYSERLAAARIEEREKQKIYPSHRTDQTEARSHRKTGPCCPRCGKVMVLRTARKGRRAGSQFWGCSTYPGCQCTLPFNGSDRSV